MILCYKAKLKAILEYIDDNKSVTNDKDDNHNKTMINLCCIKCDTLLENYTKVDLKSDDNNDNGF